MNRPGLTTEIHDLADDLYGADPALDQMIRAAVALHHTELDHVQLSAILTRTAGQNSLLNLLALVFEGKAESKAVQDLDTPHRHGAKAALHSLIADLNLIAETSDAGEAAWHLDPA
jgi:hypothetical protein